MRYTTIIDITDIPQVYNNINATRVYLHLCLTCGFTADDMDTIRISYRQLAAQLSMTLAAVRHSLSLLIRYHLITIEDNIISVRKYLPKAEYKDRPKTQQAFKDEQFRKKVKADFEKSIEEAKNFEEEQKIENQRRKQQREAFCQHYKAMKERADKGDLEAQQYINKPTVKIRYESWTKTLNTE